MTVTTTNHNEKILYFIGTFCKNNYLVDQAIWNYIGADQSPLFGTFVDSFDYKQELLNIEYKKIKRGVLQD